MEWGKTENQEKPTIVGIRILLLPAAVATVLYCIKPTNVVSDLYEI